MTGEQETVQRAKVVADEFDHDPWQMAREIERLRRAAHEPPCEHEWSAIRRVHTCLRGCGAEMSATTGAVTQPTQPPGESHQDARDAARYRFLRDPRNSIIYARDPNAWGYGWEGHIRFEKPEHLDAAIDAVITSGPTKCDEAGK